MPQSCLHCRRLSSAIEGAPKLSSKLSVSWRNSLKMTMRVHYSGKHVQELAECWKTACSSAADNRASQPQEESKHDRAWVRLILKSLDPKNIRYNIERMGRPREYLGQNSVRPAVRR